MIAPESLRDSHHFQPLTWRSDQGQLEHAAPNLRALLVF